MSWESRRHRYLISASKPGCYISLALIRALIYWLMNASRVEFLLQFCCCRTSAESRSASLVPTPIRTADELQTEWCQSSNFSFLQHLEQWRWRCQPGGGVERERRWRAVKKKEEGSRWNKVHAFACCFLVSSCAEPGEWVHPKWSFRCIRGEMRGKDGADKPSNTKKAKIILSEFLLPARRRMRACFSHLSRDRADGWR